MTISISTAAARVLANAAAVATAMAGGTTTAEAQGLADLLLVLSKRNDYAVPLLMMGGTAAQGPTGVQNISPG